MNSPIPTIVEPTATHPSFLSLMTRERWIEIGRIVAVAVLIALVWKRAVPVSVLWSAVVVGLYPLVKTALTELLEERTIGTEIFVTLRSPH
jgi:Zn2+/Cd2+-exporting ATPase